MVTKKSLAELAYHNNFIPVRGCSICGSVIGYFVYHDALKHDEIHCEFDSSCDCAQSQPRGATVEEVLDFMNSREVAK